MQLIAPVLVLLITLAAPCPAQTASAPSQAAIDQALAEARHALWSTQNASGRLAARSGEHALVLLALLHAGERLSDPRVVRALLQLDGSANASTYDQALRLMVVDAVRERSESDSRFFLCETLLPRAERDLKGLVAAQTESGGWSYDASSRARPADNSNTQYAALGLRAGHALGFQIPHDTWAKLLRHQIGSSARRGGAGYANANGPSVSMTAAVLSTLLVSRARVRLQDPGQRRAEGCIVRHLKYLTEHWQPGQPASHRHYTLYSLERAMVFAGADRLGERDWYAEGARWLLDQPRNEGRWGSSAVATSFAVLFLTRGLRARGGETLDPVGFLLGKLDPQSREFEIEAAVDTVCKMGRAALPALLPLLESEERVVRKAAVSILRRLVKERGGYDPEESPRSLENQRAIARWKEIIDHLPS